MMQTPPPPPGFELIGNDAPPPAPAPRAAAPRPAASRPAVRQYQGELPSDPRAVFPALVAQESGGRAGVLGPMTRYGQAQGRTQMLPATAQEMATKVGVPWRPELMTGQSPEAAAYQDRLGLAYLEQGYQQTGNMRDALRYYHGGPDRKLWGPKTQAYSEEVLSRLGGQSLPPVSPDAAPAGDVQMAAGPAPTPPPGFELVAEAPTVETALTPGEGTTEEYMRALGVADPKNPTTEDFLRLGFRPENGQWVRTSAAEATERDPGEVLALQQEAAKLAEREQIGAKSYASPDFLDQLTAPINDEVGFATGYASQALGNIGRNLMGEDIEVGALDRARAVRNLTATGQEEFQRENPGQALAGGLLGGFAFAPAAGAAVPGLLGRLGQAGGVSGAYGVAEGEGVGGRVGSGLLSAGLGVATAGALESVVPAAKSVFGAVERARTPRASLPNSAERRVGGAIEGALQRDNTTPQGLLDSLATAPEGRLPFEAGGENLIGLAETVSQAPGQARRGILAAVKERRDGANNRVAGRLADSFGAQGNGFQALRQRVTARGEAANEGMAAIEAQPIKLDAPAVQALRSNLSTRAVRNAAEEAIAELTPEGSAAANRLFGLGDELLDNPGAATLTIREAQDISFTLNEAASRAYSGGFNSRGKALKTLANAIRDNARTPERGGVQAYDDWLKSFGDASEAIDGLRTGQNVFAKANEKNAMSAAELADRWKGWSAQARENYRLGVGEAVLDKVRGAGGVTAMRKLLKDNELADRVKIAFDSDDKFIAFMKTADDEVGMANVDSQVLGGSPTARRVAGAADLNAQGVGAGDVLDFATDITSPVGLTRQSVKLAMKGLPRKDRSILGNEELNGLIGQALTDESAMTRLLNLMQTDRGIKEKATRQLRGLGLLSLPGVSASGQERTRGLLTANP